MNLNEFHFLRPEWFWALPFLFLIVLLWVFRSHGPGAWAKICDDRLLPYILDQRADAYSRVPWLLFLVASLLAIIALAGPTWERLPAPVFRNESALVILLDLSKSMDAQDIQPSRLGRARYKISDILQQRKDGLTALVVFSTEAYTVTPLTDDRATISNQLPALETSIMPDQGTRTSPALKRAVELLKQSGNPGGNVLLMTDGADPEALDAAKELRRSGYRLYVLGIGSEQGAPIPKGGGGFLNDRAGNIVVSKLEPGKLISLARAGGGSYETLTLDDTDIRRFLQSFEQVHEMSPEESRGKYADQWLEKGPWLVLGLLPLAAFAFRRGYLGLLLAVAIPFPEKAYAWQWTDLWETRDQQGYQAFQQGDYGRAAELFDDPEWKAASEYSAGKYQEALELLKEAHSANAAYNQGNALARAGRLPEALKAYDQALAVNPDDDDARYNRDLVEKLMKEQDSSRSQDSDSDSEQSKKDQESSGQEQQNESAKDSENQENKQSAENSSSEDRQEDAAQGKHAEKPDDNKSGEEESSQAMENETKGAEENQDGEDATEPKEPKESKEPGLADAEQTPEQELQQANEQWLRRIPDDPGGLLRRKFKYQYQKSNPRAGSEKDPW
ncbi:MAG: VWA domain-containing protein [Gammaproteobacteria bacterium]